ncbi:neuronal vesicle trafficking-associated protein 2 isoform X3 [Rhinatrema bivittatum]|uniref:neuronal vesicle trafficking-associated protein 2 isoform X3 n=1 Tax=Rhinatrema bivittatum TaxID=194408 RepID=UPI00112666A2|nr:neuronal vesicle trafficking-associated protein 2 isoform X3 [Rhinatrema bivittatum]
MKVVRREPFKAVYVNRFGAHRCGSVIQYGGRSGVGGKGVRLEPLRMRRGEAQSGSQNAEEGGRSRAEAASKSGSRAGGEAGEAARGKDRSWAVGCQGMEKKTGGRIQEKTLEPPGTGHWQGLFPVNKCNILGFPSSLRDGPRVKKRKQKKNESLLGWM